MNKLLLALCLLPTMLCATLDEVKLVRNLQDRIDNGCYNVTHHFCDDDAFEHAYQIGYFTALSSFLCAVENGEFDVKRD